MKFPILFTSTIALVIACLAINPVAIVAEDEDDSGRPSMSGGKGKGKGGGKGGGKGKGRRSMDEDPDPGQPTPPPAAADSAPGFVTTILEVNGREITLLKPDEGESSIGGGKGKGKKGRFRSGSGDTITMTVLPNAVITSATSARRTGDMMVGLDLPGGLSNRVFDDEVKARIIVDGGDVKEINVFVSRDEEEVPVAIKPKRPPMKTTLLNP
ncbi:MAG: hypothetical protein AAF585_14270 [Verrucomicrobiota bacterium]